jgi:hypothetical protein
MEENKIITITTTIPIKDLINKVINNNPQTECEFNNSLIYNFTDELLEKLRSQLDHQSGGKKKKRKTRKSKKKNKRTKKLRSQKGGLDPRLIVFFMSMFLVFVKGIKNVTDNDIIRRVIQVKELSNLFRNHYGTCALNTMLFLKTIDLPTFEDLTVNMLSSDQRGLSREQIGSYMNKELNIHSKWISLPGIEGELDEVVDRVIERIINTLKKIRSDYGFDSTQSIITAMSYVKKGINARHSVVVWLTGNNELIVIEPQKIERFGLELYTSESSFEQYMFNDKTIKRRLLKKYIKDNIDVQNEFNDINIFASMHIELDDTPGLDTLTQNKRLGDTIKRIREAEENMVDKKRIEF